MFKRKVKGIIVVHNDEVCWLDIVSGEKARCVFRISLEHFCSDPAIIEKVPRAHRGNYQTLCIMPDHWFGIEIFPFRSKRPSLIEPYLERRLAAAHADLPSVTHFYNYRSVSVAGDSHGVMAYLIQDPKGYQLYEALARLNLTPRWITSPGFLWTETLSKTIKDFDQAGALLIHINGPECLLYFFSKGEYLFSRNVILGPSVDGLDETSGGNPDETSDLGLDAVTYEINQSLYLFSQKTKSEPSHFYLVAESGFDVDALSQSLGRDILPLKAQIEGQQPLIVEEVPVLNTLLRAKEISQQAEFLSVTHRRVKHSLAWEPIQWVGMAVGAVLILFLIGENVLLGSLLEKAGAENRRIKHLRLIDERPLNEYDSALDSVLSSVQRPSSAETLRRLMAVLPGSIWVRELEIVLEEQPFLVLSAVVELDRASQLKPVLLQLVDQVNTHFNPSRRLSLGDIDIRNNRSGRIQPTVGFQISLRWELV